MVGSGPVIVMRSLPDGRWPARLTCWGWPAGLLSGCLPRLPRGPDRAQPTPSRPSLGRSPWPATGTRSWRPAEAPARRGRQPGRAPEVPSRRLRL